MNALLTLAAQVLVEHTANRPEVEVAAACDEVLQFLARQGCSSTFLNSFPKVVRRELQRRGRALFALLSTPGGASGAARSTLLATLEKTLAASVELEEKADATLLGGAVITVGDERLDMSLRGALQHLSHHLRSSPSTS